MNTRILVIAILSFCFLVASTVMAGGPDMKEGLWQVTVTMEMPGMPMQMPPQTFTHCLTKEDYIPYKEEPDKECKVIKFDTKGNTVTWTIRCKDEEGTSTGTGRVTYRGDTFEGLIKFKDPEGEMNMSMKGKWIGKCKK